MRLFASRWPPTVALIAALGVCWPCCSRHRPACARCRAAVQRPAAPAGLAAAYAAGAAAGLGLGVLLGLGWPLR